MLPYSPVVSSLYLRTSTWSRTLFPDNSQKNKSRAVRLEGGQSNSGSDSNKPTVTALVNPVSFPTHRPGFGVLASVNKHRFHFSLADKASTTLHPILHLSIPHSMRTYDPLESNEASPQGDPNLTLTRTHRQRDRWAAATNS